MGYALSGKTALVTGANRGIGEAIVEALVAAGVGKVMGTFEVRDSKINAWRDYFDMNQFTSRMR